MANQLITDNSEQYRYLNEARVQQLEDKIDELEAYTASLERETQEHQRVAAMLKSSEIQYRRLFESAKDGILILDADTERIVDVNPFIINLLGFPHEYFIGKKLWEIGVFKDIESSKSAFVALQKNGYIRYEDLPLETKDGRQIAVEFVSNVYLVNSARIIQCNIRDITERKDAQAAIKLHSIRVQTLLDLHLLSHAEKDTVIAFALKACLNMTHSKHSFIGVMNDSETVITLHHCFRDVMAECGASVAPVEYQIGDAGLWGECVRQRQSIRCNDYQESYPEKKGAPDIFMSIHRFMAVPVFDDGHIVAVAAVANKICDYNESDENALSILSQKMWEILSRQQKEQGREILEEQYRQAQKMEAIGQLAGGVAHDFNNILQAILGFSSMLLEELPEHGRVHEFAGEIAQSANRASDLTRQLLTFSRRQILNMEELELNDVVHGILKMICRLIREDIVITVEEGALCNIRADRSAIEQVLLNLCLNARDAMPKGGALSIKIENVMLDREYCDIHALAADGPYAMISITDTGCGMDAATQNHIFEPFFTTKRVGDGTGLGLATVYGIVQQHHGLVQVCSDPGRGTTVKMYLPAIINSTAVTAGVAEVERAKGGNETILVAEDEAVLRRLMVHVLENAGYTVLLAVNGEEALEIFEKHKTDIDLCLLDMVMPKMGGKAVYDLLHQQHPGLRFLFASGYSTDTIYRSFMLEKDVELIQKPCAPDALLRRIRQILDADHQ